MAKKKEVKKFMEIKDAAEYLGTSFQTVKKMMAEGTIPYLKVGRRYFIAREMIDKALSGEKHTKKRG